MSAIRFPKIGGIVKCHDGTYSVGPLPGIGGPFDSAAQFFEACADRAKFQFGEKSIRERTPPDMIDGVLRSIKAFPSRLKELAQSFRFCEGHIYGIPGYGRTIAYCTRASQLTCPSECSLLMSVPAQFKAIVLPIVVGIGCRSI
jgi:hypothetical protein